MHYPVRDDERMWVRRNGSKHAGRASRFPGIVAGMILLAIAAWPAAGQEASQVFEASVLDMAENSRSVDVPLNRSAIIKTTVEVNRASVTNGDIAEVQVVSPTELLITGRNYGRTNVVLWDAQDKQYLLDVAVELDVAALNESLQGIDPQGDVTARPVMGNIILSGTVSSAESAARMIEVASMFLNAGRGSTKAMKVHNHLNVAGEQQVLLRCVVAEVNRSAARRLGVNGFLAGDDFSDAFLVNQLGGINPINIGAAADAPANMAIPFLTGTDGIALDPTVPLSVGFPRVQMQLFIRALVDNSLFHILAEPNLVAISGETATFLAGGEFPIPVPQGLDSVTVEFREFGVQLNFTPVVKEHQLIRLRVAPEVSELDFTNAVQVQGFTVPGLTTRSAETTIEVGSGQTIAIAGLLSEQVRAFVSRVPGVGDVPVLGALFRSVEYRRNLSELVILVTPEIVAPIDRYQVPSLPGDELQVPNDFELYMLGKLEGKPNPDMPRPVHPVDVVMTPQSDPESLSVHGPWGHANMQE